MGEFSAILLRMAATISIPLFGRSFNAIVKIGQIVFVPDITGAAIAARFRFWGTAFAPGAEQDLALHTGISRTPPTKLSTDGLIPIIVFYVCHILTPHHEWSCSLLPSCPWLSIGFPQLGQISSSPTLFTYSRMVATNVAWLHVRGDTERG